jgi:hypothetical protein
MLSVKAKVKTNSVAPQKGSQLQNRLPANDEAKERLMSLVVNRSLCKGGRYAPDSKNCVEKGVQQKLTARAPRQIREPRLPTHFKFTSIEIAEIIKDAITTGPSGWTLDTLRALVCLFSDQEPSFSELLQQHSEDAGCISSVHLAVTFTQKVINNTACCISNCKDLLVCGHLAAGNIRCFILLTKAMPEIEASLPPSLAKLVSLCSELKKALREPNDSKKKAAQVVRNTPEQDPKLKQAEAATTSRDRLGNHSDISTRANRSSCAVEAASARVTSPLKSRLGCRALSTERALISDKIGSLVEEFEANLKRSLSLVSHDYA